MTDPQRGYSAAGAVKVWTVGGLLQWTEQFFGQKGVESPRLDAQILLAHALGCDRIHIYTRFDEPVGEAQRGQFRDLVRRRVEGCPVAYLVGRKEFFKLSFEVTPAVLIPRPATESLVVRALELLKPLAKPQVLDVGTGSGCIAVSVAKQHAGATVLAVDVSDDALAVARRNAERHGVADRVTVLNSDLFARLDGDLPFDLILSNPPYIPAGTLAALAREVRDHEPRTAIDGGPDGLAVFDRLIVDAADRLTAGGWLLVEIGFDQEAEALRRLATAPGLTPGATVRDADGHPRVVTARRAEPSPRSSG
jgi:release factor glutamine methyltransferase